MNRYLIICVVLLCGLCGCRPKKPKDIADKATMVQVTLDIYLSEAKIKSMRLPADSASQLYSRVEPAIYRRHGLDSASYHRSLEYYLENLAEYEKILTVVIDSLSLQERLARAGDEEEE